MNHSSLFRLGLINALILGALGAIPAVDGAPPGNPPNPNQPPLSSYVGNYDRGPSASWEAMFASAPWDYYVTHPLVVTSNGGPASAPFRTEFGPVYYRGRLNGTARVLIVGQDPATDEIIAHRNFVGSAGQRVQGLLTKLGITKSYVMINTFLCGIHGTMNAAMDAVAVEPTILNYRNGLFDKIKAENKLQAIISFGNGGHLAIQNWPGRPMNIPWFQLTHPSAPDYGNPPDVPPTSWNTNLAAMHAAITPDNAALVDMKPYVTPFSSVSTDIPRADLPFGISAWHGTGAGTNSHRSGNNEIDWTAP